MTPVMTTSPDDLGADDLTEVWPILTEAERQEAFAVLERHVAEDFYLTRSTRDQFEILEALPAATRRSWIRILPPDDVADLLQISSDELRESLLALLDDTTRKEVAGLLAYHQDQAGGLMNPRYARVRPEMTIDEAIAYVRKQAREGVETLPSLYVLDSDQKLLGLITLRYLLSAPADRRIQDVMMTDVVTVTEDMDQEKVGRIFTSQGAVAIPVVDPEGRMKGVVTADDVVHVVSEEATEDMQKVGGMEALDEPYLDVAFGRMLKKRAGWLCVLFLGETLTASAMGHFESEIARALVLMLFVPLIISSGGNSGSQATTLVIRAMALGEVKLRDWWRVVRREFMSGLALGVILGGIGMIRIILWQALFHTYGEHYFLIALTVSISLVGVVLWGTIAGSMLPFVLRSLKQDPASASAPFVATLVDVSGLVIYFSVAHAILSGTLL